jgi:hypothetical protein
MACKCHPGLSGSLAMPTYGAGSPLAVADLLSEQQYRTQRLRRHLRYLHGWGVVCGLHVVAGRNPRLPWDICVCPGYAISPCGDEILVPQQVCIDVADSLWSAPSRRTPPLTYVVIRYVAREWQMRPKPSSVCGCSCACEDSRYLFARLADSFAIDMLWTPLNIPTVLYDLCSGTTPACPVCPDTCDVVLASIALPPSPDQQITDGEIDNTIRRRLF